MLIDHITFKEHADLIKAVKKALNNGSSKVEIKGDIIYLETYTWRTSKIGREDLSD